MDTKLFYFQFNIEHIYPVLLLEIIWDRSIFHNI